MRPLIAAGTSTLCLLALLPVTAVAGVVPVKSVSASSHYTESGNYTPERVVDGRQGTSWVEGDDGAGLGAWVELDLGEAHSLDAIRIWGGDWYNDTNWNRANRPKELEIKLDEGSPKVVTLKDERTVQQFDLGGARATTVRVRLKSTYSGTTWPDTGISEIQLIGDAAAPGHAATVTASSQAPADGDGSYGPEMVADQIDDSMWCEGSEGDGTGESLTFDFGKPVPVSSMTWLSGIGTSLPLWMQANRPMKITLAFDDGSHTTDVKPSFRSSTVSFPTVTTSRVTMTFDAVVKGAKYNDLCVSEAWFSE